MLGYEHAEGGLQELSWCVVSHAAVTSVRNSLALPLEMWWQEDWECLQSLPWFPCWFSVQRDSAEKYLSSPPPFPPSPSARIGLGGHTAGGSFAPADFYPTPVFSVCSKKHEHSPYRASTKALWGSWNRLHFVGISMWASITRFGVFYSRPAQSFAKRLTKTNEQGTYYYFYILRREILTGPCCP